MVSPPPRHSRSSRSCGTKDTPSLPSSCSKSSPLPHTPMQHIMSEHRSNTLLGASTTSYASSGEPARTPSPSSRPPPPLLTQRQKPKARPQLSHAPRRSQPSTPTARQSQKPHQSHAVRQLPRKRSTQTEMRLTPRDHQPRSARLLVLRLVRRPLRLLLMSRRKVMRSPTSLVLLRP